jgi:hypothetical protein
LIVRKSKRGPGRPKGTLRGRKEREVIACSPEAKMRLMRWALDHEVTLHLAADTAIGMLTMDQDRDGEP